MYEKALKNYKPSHYPGRIIIFKGQQSLKVTEGDWIRLEADDKALHRLDDATHRELLHDPHLSVWVEKLKYQLRRHLK